jgi:hypothetical protein
MSTPDFRSFHELAAKIAEQQLKAVESTPTPWHWIHRIDTDGSVNVVKLSPDGEHELVALCGHTLNDRSTAAENARLICCAVNKRQSFISALHAIRTMARHVPNGAEARLAEIGKLAQRALEDAGLFEGASSQICKCGYHGDGVGPATAMTDDIARQIAECPAERAAQPEPPEGKARGADGR